MRMRFRARPESPWARAAKGTTAGILGTIVMTQAQTRLLSKIPSGKAPKEPRFPREPEAGAENAPETLARRFVEGVTHRPLPKPAKSAVGLGVHFGTGAFWGAVMGLLMPRRLSPQGMLGLGAAYGAGVWAFNDNLVLPLFRLGDWPNRYGLGTHAKAFLAHAIYGMATAVSYRELAQPRFSLAPGLGLAMGKRRLRMAKALYPAGKALRYAPARKLAARTTPLFARTTPLIARAAMGRRMGPVKMGAWGIRAG
ncbi:MAG TPA: hypothetical protein VGD74_07090 [Vulgatibacter sp.]